MSWLTTIVTGILTAAAGLFLSGYVANLSVRWYRISSFEGGSGYYVVLMALMGLLVGLVVGIVVSRVVAHNANPGLLKAIGTSLAIMLALVGVTGGIARLVADVPPTVDGEELMLVVEARFPETQVESPANSPGIAYLELGSVSGSHVQRLAKRGALWKEDAHKVDGRWIVTGAVPIFTERGTRSLDIALNDKERSGFIIPLGRRPGKGDFAWSEWYPREGKGGPVRATGMNYRYRVQKLSEPVRTETVGPFEVSTIANSFMTDAAPGTTTLDGFAHFTLRYNGKPIVLSDGGNGAGTVVHDATGEATQVDAVAMLPGQPTALIVLVPPFGEASRCDLFIDDNGTLRQTQIGPCNYRIQAEELPVDSSRFESMRAPTLPRGRVDRHTFAGSTLLLFNNAVLDVPARAVRKFAARTSSSVIPSVPPLGVAPDHGSFARFTLGNESSPQITVIDFVHDAVYDMPFDRARMRYAELENLNPAWLAHHFVWQTGSNGAATLVERKRFTPIPYSGVLSADSAGTKRYRIGIGGQKVRLALLEFLEREFKAQRDSVGIDVYEYPLQVGRTKITVATSGEPSAYVLVEVKGDTPDNALVERIATQFNALLATGKYDEAFIQKRE